jgi:hypothetical protein
MNKHVTFSFDDDAELIKAVLTNGTRRARKTQEERAALAALRNKAAGIAKQALVDRYREDYQALYQAAVQVLQEEAKKDGAS